MRVALQTSYFTLIFTQKILLTLHFYLRIIGQINNYLKIISKTIIETKLTIF